MKIVYAYNTKGGIANLHEKTELTGKTANSFTAMFKFLTEGDHATVEVGSKGFKQISIRDGAHYIQRNYVYEW